MLRCFKKSFWVPYDDPTVYPAIAKAREAIAEYCDKNGYAHTFTDDDAVTINGVPHEIYRGPEPGSRGCYGIKCTER